MKSVSASTWRYTSSSSFPSTSIGVVMRVARMTTFPAASREETGNCACACAADASSARAATGTNGRRGIMILEYDIYHIIMPWSSTHKTETRERILHAAASAFRAEGVAAIGVGDVMGRAGLTHGGFYAHFESKEQLVAEALRYASGQTTRAFDRTAASAGDR